jgi:hypothetical protein
MDLGAAVTFRENVAKGDGYLELVIAEDGMTATADLYPPKAGGLPLDIEQAKSLFARLGIVEGIDWARLEDAVLRCALDRTAVRGLLVAKGRPAEPAEPEHAVLEEKFHAKPAPAPDGALRYDFRERRALLVVRKGETLATVVPAASGSDGKDIRGRYIPSPHRQVSNALPGKNVAKEENRLVSLVDGLLAPIGENGGRLDVEEVLLVRGSVDYHTGHIVFPGDVIIEGAISDGFKVWSGGSIHCRTTMDAFDVNAKKDLLCDQGIIGRRKAQVRVGGELRAKFIQNCRVAARGDIHVQTAIVNSQVYCLGRVELGDKGVFMGGDVFAVHGLKAYRLGNQAHQSTMVHAGTDFTVQQRLDQANERLRELAVRGQRARAAAGEKPDRSSEVLLSKIAEAEAALHVLVGQLLGSLDTDENAVVEVSGEIYPGTVIDICRVNIVVDELLTACRFRLDKNAGIIRVERGGSKGEARKAFPPAAPRPGRGAH